MSAGPAKDSAGAAPILLCAPRACGRQLASSIRECFEVRGVCCKSVRAVALAVARITIAKQSHT